MTEVGCFSKILCHLTSVIRHLMPFALNLYHDQVAAGGASAQPLPPAHRLLYVRHGSAIINDQPMGADTGVYCDGPVTLQAADGWSQVWRWELALPNATPFLHQGSGVLSTLRMARVVTSLAMLEGTRWLFRLDQITSAAGRIADRHQHPGPGIRCLLEGAFNVQSEESVRDLAPGDAWWETGPDTVVAWGSTQMAARFLRGMVLPVEWEGKATGTWLSGEAARPRPGNWRLLVDKVIAV
jgi:hypothetical protein